MHITQTDFNGQAERRSHSFPCCT